jgi:putative salt-induced outer membrane protein YdiY
MLSRLIRNVLIAGVSLMAWSVSPLPAFADEVSLMNGDRYTGTVLSLASGTLAFDTGHGRVDLPWPTVTTLSVEDPIVVTADGAEKQTVSGLTSADGWVALADGAAVPLKAVVALARPRSPFTFSGGASAGLLATGGNSGVNSVRVDADLVARLYENRYTARASVNRAKDRGVETARDASAEIRYDRFLTRTVFANGSALFTSDRFRDLDLRSNLGFGLGFQIADNTRTKISLEGGYGYVNEQYTESDEPDRSYSALREATNLEVYFLAKRYVLFHRADTFVSLSDSTQTPLGPTVSRNVNSQIRNGLRIGLGLGLVMTLQLDIDYVRSPAAGRKPTDRRTGLTFGYRF